MTRTTFVRSLLPLVAVASCARLSFRASDAPEAGTLPSEFTVPLGAGIAVRPGPRLDALPAGQRYRFVSADSLALGVTSEDIASATEPPVAALRERFSAVVSRARWTESSDSAQFDVTIFTTTRSQVRHRSRDPLVTDARTAEICNLRDAEIWRLQPSCKQEPVGYTGYEHTERHTVTILRRRSDGATRVWREIGLTNPELRYDVGIAVKRMLRR